MSGHFYLTSNNDIFFDMPTFVGHSLVALTVSAPLQKTPLGTAMSFSGWVTLLVMVSLLPDLDVLMLRWLPYSHPLSHRGLGHSLFFALVASLCITISCYFAGIIRGKLLTLFLVWLVLAIVMGSHGILDAMTDGGLGIGLLSPVDVTRYFFPVRPIPVALLSPSTMFSPYMMHVYTVEVALFGTFCLAAWLACAELSGLHLILTVKWLAAVVFFIIGIATWIARCQSV